MLLELIRALVAASLVALLPGWFWAGCLLAAADRAERITYSMALSMALVPATALAAVRLLDTGVTLAVAVSSALVVFFTGLLAYLRFGPAKGTYEPTGSRYSPPDFPVLVVLLPAFGLALWAGLRMVPGQVYGLPVAPLATVALLVFVAGVVHLVVSLRKPAPQEPALKRHSPLRARRLPAGCCYPRCCCWCSYGVTPAPCCTTGRSCAA